MSRNTKPTDPTKGERIAKVMARAGLCSRREAERWIEAGRVSVNGKKLSTPAHTVTDADIVTVDGKPVGDKQESKLWRYHKPAGLIVSHGDPEGRATVFEKMPPDMPRVVSVGRLDINSEGLLLMTNDGALANLLESPKTGWTRKYRVRVHGNPDPKALAGLENGVTVSGLRYGPIKAELETTKDRKAANAWISVSLQEGKNREVRKVMEHLGLNVNRLIRTGYGPFQLGSLPRGGVEEIKRAALRSSLPKGFKLD